MVKTAVAHKGGIASRPNWTQNKEAIIHQQSNAGFFPCPTPLTQAQVFAWSFQKVYT